MKLIRLSIASFAVVLGACSILPSNPPTDAYRLPDSQVSVQFAPKPLGIVIPEPYANRFLNHQRLTVVLENNEVQAYSGVNWVDIAPKVFRDRLVDDFRRARAYQTVVKNDELINLDRLLQTDIQAYQIQYQQGKPYVVIDVNVALINRRQGNIIGASNFRQERELSSAQIETVMQAFGEVSDQVNTQILQWVRAQE
ncbi:hypothetical protein F9B74_08480 [Pelistega sp. NLN82]|uniref:ABC-type transport auxiliary lipoprotein component domain-containing protein n=1 Tax=Pelistega ratti TaxID=2652177 RepID=A0A6L9Y778_9BURK|nr:ABC-type transport auxiliary lipoprotein family protein [Pelistega ratti]NEN76352.1 hypothetical protein [Pelistega ratti]